MFLDFDLTSKLLTFILIISIHQLELLDAIFINRLPEDWSKVNSEPKPHFPRTSLFFPFLLFCSQRLFSLSQLKVLWARSRKSLLELSVCFRILFLREPLPQYV
jgi:hypothetical protein